MQWPGGATEVVALAPVPLRWWPRSLRPQLSQWLPDHPGEPYGPRVARWSAIAYLLLITARSLIHLFAPDGGAQSIAGVDLGVGGGPNIVALFAQWGAIQLLLAGLLWLLLLRYPGLCPLVLSALAVEPLLRMLAGRMKPFSTLHPAPGAVLNDWMLPLLLVLLWLSLCPAGEAQEPA